MGDQDDFFGGPREHAQKNAVDTSIDAVAKIDITKQATKILWAYADGAALLDEEAYRRHGMDGHQRCSDLRAKGLIERVDKKITRHGDPGYRCRITDLGRAFLARRPPTLL